MCDYFTLTETLEREGRHCLQRISEKELPVPITAADFDCSFWDWGQEECPQTEAFKQIKLCLALCHANMMVLNGDPVVSERQRSSAVLNRARYFVWMKRRWFEIFLNSQCLSLISQIMTTLIHPISGIFLLVPEGIQSHMFSWKRQWSKGKFFWSLKLYFSVLFMLLLILESCFPFWNEPKAWVMIRNPSGWFELQ